MLTWAILFLLFAVVSAWIGFAGVIAGLAATGKVLFFVFLVVSMVALVLGVLGRGR